MKHANYVARGQKALNIEVSDDPRDDQYIIVTCVIGEIIDNAIADANHSGLAFVAGFSVKMPEDEHNRAAARELAEERVEKFAQAYPGWHSAERRRSYTNLLKYLECRPRSLPRGDLLIAMADAQSRALKAATQHDTYSYTVLHSPV